MKDRNDCFSEITVPEDVLTFAEACERVAEGGKILLKHGLHTVAECVTLEKNIVILGDQIYPEKIILKGGKNAVLEMKAGFSEIRGITFLNEGSSCQAAIEFCASLGILAKCVFISEKGSGLSVLAKGANPVVSACVAQNCGESGFYVCGGAGGVRTVSLRGTLGLELRFAVSARIQRWKGADSWRVKRGPEFGFTAVPLEPSRTVSL